MSLCYVAFGSNVGDSVFYITKVLELLKDYGRIKRVSTLYVSKPWGKTDQPDFINGVLEFETRLDPIALLVALKELEQRVGRKPRERWGPREIDLDILLYGNYVVMMSFLKIPHPHLTDRDFFLFPLLELNPALIHPLYGTGLKEYARKLENRLSPFACLLPL